MLQQLASCAPHNMFTMRALLTAGPAAPPTNLAGAVDAVLAGRVSAHAILHPHKQGPLTLAAEVAS